MQTFGSHPTATQGEPFSFLRLGKMDDGTAFLTPDGKPLSS